MARTGGTRRTSADGSHASSEGRAVRGAVRGLGRRSAVAPGLLAAAAPRARSRTAATCVEHGHVGDATRS